MSTAEPFEHSSGLAELDEAACWKLLEDDDVGRLAVTVGTHPEIFPVNYLVSGRQIVIRTEAGTMLAGAVGNHAVAFEIDSIDRQQRSGWSVVAFGWAREPQQVEELAKLDDMGLDLWVVTPKSRWLVIDVDRVTGRVLPPPAI